MSEAAEKEARMVVGQVVSVGANKTISVMIERKVPHPFYRKFVKRSTKLLAHDENNDCNEGDTVAIEECRPISKRKSWRLQSIIERATRV
ncbi:MAG: 30S ribosomal protein S17 [Pseudomonadota bacterium]